MTIVHVYFAFLLIGVIGLLSSLLFGDTDADFDHDLGSNDFHHGGDADSPKLLSLRVIFSFLLAFSIGGGAVYLSDKPLGSQLIVGILSGIVTALAVFYFMKFLYSFQGVSNINSNDFIDKQAIVTVGTTSQGLCQIEVDSTGGDRLFMAQEVNGKKLKKNDAVKVKSRTGTTLIVEKI